MAAGSGSGPAVRPLLKASTWSRTHVLPRATDCRAVVNPHATGTRTIPGLDRTPGCVTLGASVQPLGAKGALWA